MGRRTIGAGLVALGLGLALQAGAQDVYRWTDNEGKVHFTDTPPPADATAISQKRMGVSVPEQALPYATQLAMKRHPVTLYVADKCPPCNKARQLLAGRGVPYTEHNAQGNAQEMESVKKLGGSAEVPLLLVGDKTIKGYEEATWTTALDAAGYPASLQPGQRAPEPQRVGGPTAAAPGDTAQAR